MRQVNTRRGLRAAGLLAVGAWLVATVATQAPNPVSHEEIIGQKGFQFGEKKPPIKWDGPRRMQAQAKNMKVVGWTDMNGHADGEQIDGAVINGRDYIVYGHYWSQGATIVDVTDPAKPEVVSFIQNRDPYGHYTKVIINNKNILMMPVGTLSELDQEKRHILKDHGVVFYDINDPKHPKFLSFYRTGPGTITEGNHGVHYSWFTDDYAYISAPVEGYQGTIMLVLDARDPKNPKEIGRWWVPGQHTAGGEKLEAGWERIWAHGTMTNRDATLGFYCILSDPPGGMYILDIKDKTKPKMLSRLDLSPPMRENYFGLHNVVTMDSRNILATMNESGNGTGFIVDYANPSKPTVLAVLPKPIGFDLSHPARMGPHNAHENQPGSLIDDWMLYISWFRAGVRLFDLTDPRNPIEVGNLLPPDPKYRNDDRTWSGKPGDPNGSELSSLNHVYVDQRGYIYTSGYNDGLYIMQYTGPRPKGSQTALAEAQKLHAEAIAKKTGGASK